MLVTGAAGFIGSHLCRRLVADGVDVVAMDDLSEGSVDALRDLPEVRFVEADIRDEATLSDAAKGCDAILHQAAKRSVPFSIREPGLVTDVNLRGSFNVLLAARDVGAVFVQASSSSVYGDQDSFPVRETMQPLPRSPYAAAKAAAELYATACWHSYRVPTVSLRYFNAYGPGQDPESEYAAVVPRFVSACLTGERPVVHGDGQQSRDFTYIDDVVEANIRAMYAKEPAYGLAFNVGGVRRRPRSANCWLWSASCAESRRSPNTPRLARGTSSGRRRMSRSPGICSASGRRFRSVRDSVGPSSGSGRCCRPPRFPQTS